MSKIVIADSSCLIALSKIGELKLLEQLFSHVFIPQAVYKEVVIRGEGRPGSKEVSSAAWIKVQNISDKLAVDALRLQLGLGESEAIVLTVELKADFIILDDWRARQAAVEPKAAGHWHNGNINQGC
jgi:predicted nucleic acid-binding protein